MISPAFFHNFGTQEVLLMLLPPTPGARHKPHLKFEKKKHLFSNTLWHQPLLVGFRVQSHTRGVVQGLFQPADIKSSRAQKGEHPPGAEKSGTFVDGGVFFWWLETRFFFWCWEKSYCFLPNLLELDDGVGTSIGFASDLLWYMQGNRRYFWKHVKQWLGWCLNVKILLKLKPTENFRSSYLSNNPANTKGNNVPHHNIKKHTKLDTEHQWNYGADWKINWEPVLELGMIQNSTTDPQKNLSAILQCHNFSKYMYTSPTKTTTDGLPENHHRNGKENSSDPNI